MSDSAVDYTFARYLSAKRTVDDRALNHAVWQALAAMVAHRQDASARRLEVLEIGAGIGTMVERALAWNLFAGPHKDVTYHALDADVSNVDSAHSNLHTLPDWLEVHFEAADVFDFVERPEVQSRYDLLIAHAFLDLVDIQRVLPKLKRSLRPSGLFYFTINFDGVTSIQPELDPLLDAQIESAYHRTMDERVTAGYPSGDSHSGRHLFGHLKNAGFRTLAAGSSDWVVHAVDGVYPADEAYFLHFIIHTMDDALVNHPALDECQFADWITKRHTQVDRGDLVYIAHQIDFCGTIG